MKFVQKTCLLIALMVCTLSSHGPRGVNARLATINELEASADVEESTAGAETAEPQSNFVSTMFKKVFDIGKEDSSAQLDYQLHRHGESVESVDATVVIPLIHQQVQEQAATPGEAKYLIGKLTQHDDLSSSDSTRLQELLTAPAGRYAPLSEEAFRGGADIYAPINILGPNAHSIRPESASTASAGGIKVQEMPPTTRVGISEYYAVPAEPRAAPVPANATAASAGAE